MIEHGAYVAVGRLGENGGKYRALGWTNDLEPRCLYSNVLVPMTTELLQLFDGYLSDDVYCVLQQSVEIPSGLLLLKGTSFLTPLKDTCIISLRVSFYSIIIKNSLKIYKLLLTFENKIVVENFVYW